MLDLPWLLFIAASLAIILTPGPDLILVMTRGLGQGSRAGLISALGISTGLIGHSLLAAFGLGALLMASNLAFTLIKFIGAAYLLYIGVKLLRARGDQFQTDGPHQEKDQRSMGQIYLEGAFCNIANPKITLFYLAFLPQFVPADNPQASLSIFLLGLTFALLTLCLKGVSGYFAGRFSNWLKSHPTLLTGFLRLCGAGLIGLSVRLAFEERA